MSAQITVSQYLIEKLRAYGVEHAFGIPGDYVLGFYDELERSPLQVINTSDEQGAGFAADAYARIRGLGVVVITYTVGGLKVTNTTAQAFAEKSPVVIISGAPGTQERKHHPLLHHKVKDYDTQFKIFQELTVASTVLNNADTACREIDRVLAAALRFKRPVYIELPRDMAAAPCLPVDTPLPVAEPSHAAALQEAIQEATALINGARQPVILAGVEIHRIGFPPVRGIVRRGRRHDRPRALDVLHGQHLPLCAHVRSSLERAHRYHHISTIFLNK